MSTVAPQVAAQYLEEDSNDCNAFILAHSLAQGVVFFRVVAHNVHLWRQTADKWRQLTQIMGIHLELRPS